MIEFFYIDDKGNRIGVDDGKGAIKPFITNDPSFKKLIEMTKKKKNKGFECSDLQPLKQIEPCKIINTSALGIDKIEVKAVTKYFAKRKTVRAAVEYFILNPEKETVYVEAICDEAQDVFHSTVFRDILIDLTFDFLKEENKPKLYDPLIWNKSKIELIFMHFDDQVF